MSALDELINKYSNTEETVDSQTNDAVSNKSSSIIDELINKANERSALDKINTGNKNTFVNKKEQEALAAKDEPTFFSESMRSLIGGTVDATNKVTGIVADAGNLMQEKLSIPYYIEFGNDNGILDSEDVAPWKWLKKMPEGVDASKYLKEKNKKAGFKENNPWELPEADANETIAGKVARDITRFITGYALTRKAIKPIYKDNKKINDILNRRKIDLKTITKIKDKAGEIKKRLVTSGSKLLETTGTGLLAGQLISDGDDGRLSDLLIQIPALNESKSVKAALDYLKTNPDDDEATNRLKMAIEDVLITLPVEAGLKAIKVMYGGSKDAINKVIKEKANLIESNSSVIDEALNLEAIKIKPVKDRTAIEKILVKRDEGKKLTKPEQVQLDDFTVAQKMKSMDSTDATTEAYVRENMGIKANQTPTEAENEIIKKITNLKRTFNSEKIDEIPSLNIKFTNNKGEPLYSGADDGVDTLVNDIVNQLDQTKKMAKARGTVQSNETTVKRAINLGLTDKALKRLGRNVLNPEVVTASRILLVASANNVKRISDAVVRNPENAKLLKGDLELAITRHQAILEKIAGLKGNAGRTLQAFNIDIGGSTLFKDKQIDDMVTVFGNDTLGMARRIHQQGDDAINGVIKDKFNSTFTDKINALFYFNFLSNPSTYLVNAIGNAGTLAYETMIQLPMSASVSTIRRIGQGLGGKQVSKDGVYFREITGRLKGTLQATLPAISNAFKAGYFGELPVSLRRGKTTEYEEMVLAGKGTEKKGLLSKIGSGIIKTPGSILLGTDAFFKTLAKGAFIHQMAYREAAKKGYSVINPNQVIGGKTQTQFIQDFLKQERPILEKKALEDAARLTFTQDGKLAQTVSKIKRVPVLGNITVSYFPFVRTPINLLEFSMENSIFAKITPGYNKLVKAGGAEKDTAIGRMLAGTSLMTGFLFYGEEGKITGTGDKNWRVNSTAKDGVGYQTKSVRDEEGNYHEFSRFDPASTIIGFTADFRDIMRTIQYMPESTKTEEYVSHATKMIMSSVWSNVADKAMLSGLSELSKDIVTAERGFASEGSSEYATRAILKQLARASSPNILRSAASSKDPYVRDTYTVLQVIKNSLPFKTLNPKEFGIPIDYEFEGKQSLPLRFDMFGRLMYIPQYGPDGFAEKLPKEIRSHVLDLTGVNEKNIREFIYEGGSAPEESTKEDLIQQATTLSRMSIYKDDAFGKELIALKYENKQLPRKQSFKGIKVELDEEQFAIYSMLAGLEFYQLGHQMINSDIYKSLPPKEKQENLAKIRTTANAFAKQHVFTMFSKKMMESMDTNYLKSRRDAPYYENLPEFMIKGYLKDKDLK
tara:strand:+ start:826 stop:4842 length:4017 start_codon:yes stop_codon:yes gene_type:complete